MRLSASILVGALALATEAAVRFSAPVWRPDLGISVPTLADSVAEPLELPKADSFLVTAPDGTRTSYTQADREFRLTQTGKYKIEAAIAPAAGETVTERVVAVITVQ